MTNKEKLQDITTRTSTTQEDDSFMKALLNRIGFPESVVTCGIVYLEGRGTIDAPPVSISSMAAMILKQA